MKANLLSRSRLVALAITCLLLTGGSLLRAQAPAPPRPSPPVAANANASGSNAEDIRDIRGPQAVPSPETWLLEALAAVAVAALAYGAWRWYRHVSTAPKLPYEIALARLEKVRRLMRPEHARQFSIEVSEIVRSYIEARFKVHATHQTTEEFLHDLLQPSDALLAGHQELLADFLHHCDLAKFAKWILSLEEMEQMHSSARTFVLETGKAVRPTPPHATPVSKPAPVAASTANSSL